ncbi:membrane protein insertion efficiency factor YidD [Ningiella sp. W23]|uniref:membrane protein insertion efficiency factor YidD n=1 Tax=Ningiella sp. W23 TaxID=3023715 RepID=UPI0037563C57
MSVKLPTKTATTMNGVLSKPFIGAIDFYRSYMSPLLGQNCRFHPSCSCYARQALTTHGLMRGTMLTMKRIVKCHPLHPGGFDYVPEPKNNHAGIEHTQQLAPDIIQSNEQQSTSKRQTQQKLTLDR